MKFAFAAVLLFAVAGLAVPAQAECVWGNCQNGRGTIRHPDGAMETGVFQDGELIVSKGRAEPVRPRPKDSTQDQKRKKPGQKSRRASQSKSCVRGDCIHGHGLRTYRDGSNYDGGFRNGVRHGQGVHVSKTGQRYEGSWAADRRHGFGVQTYRDGKYQGTWRKGVPTREGVRSYTNGDRYVGEFRRERRHGQGTLTYANGDRYVGAFEADQPHGVGKRYSKAGVKEGRWSAGRLIASGSSPAPFALVAGGQGCLSGNCWSGKGRFVYEDGSEYVGEFREGHPHGRGSLTQADGRVDSGKWEKGKRVGRRVIATPGAVARWRRNSKTSHGCKKGDCRNGVGIYRWKDGSRYSGDFRDARPHGTGKWEHPNGSSYEGQWKRGVRHGKGVERTLAGGTRRGVWDEGYAQVGSRAPTLRRSRTARLRWPDLSRAAPAVKDGKRDAAVVIGIERYAHVSRIPGAADNATAWYEYFVRTRGIPVQHVSLLLDQDATVEDMRWAVDEAAKQVRKGGTLWFVFVGHGAPSRNDEDGLLIGFDAQQKARSVQVRSLSRSDLLKRLETSSANSIRVLLDACFSGRSHDGEQLVAGLQPLVVTQDSESEDPRTSLFTAARNDEFAGPLPGAQRPAFSYLALGGLRGWADGDRDGSVTAEELHAYVGTALKVLVRDRRQRNTFSGSPNSRLSRKAREKGPKLSSLAVALARGSE